MSLICRSQFMDKGDLTFSSLMVIHMADKVTMHLLSRYVLSLFWYTTTNAARGSLLVALLY